MLNRLQKSVRPLGPMTLTALIILFSLSATACRPPLTAQPTRYIIFVDTTASITQKQSAHWREVADAAIAKLRPGDALAIYEITDRTLESRALFEAETPPCSSDAGHSALVACKRHLSSARTGAREALQKALGSENHAHSTDIFSAIDRVDPDPSGRRTVLLFLSDMLHSLAEKGDPNLETSVIVPDHIGPMIEAIAQHHGWRSARLPQAEIHVILPSASSGDARPLNDRRVLKQFYERLFAALGARLFTFDTSLAQSLG